MKMEWFSLCIILWVDDESRRFKTMHDVGRGKGWWGRETKQQLKHLTLSKLVSRAMISGLELLGREISDSF
jgi:hypothetical protein